MASCCAMPAPTFAIQPAAASCQEHLPYCHINLDVWGDRRWGSYEYGIAGRQYDAIDWALQCSLIDLCLRSPCKRVASSLYIADGVIMQQALPTPSRSFSPLSPFLYGSFAAPGGIRPHELRGLCTSIAHPRAPLLKTRHGIVLYKMIEA